MEDKNQPIVSAIFMDFDNWLGGISMDADSALGAKEVATGVKKLHDSLVEGKDLSRDESGPLFGRRRRLIDRRAYANARGKLNVLDEGAFYDYFLHLMRIGFEVVDCQSISLRNKSHADVRMTMDIVQLLERRVDLLDEVILVSSDTDFSPLINALQSQGLYVTLIACGATNESFKLFPDHYIEHGEALEYMGWLEDKHKSPPSDSPERDPKEAKQEAIDLINNQLERSDAPIPTAFLGLSIRELIGSERIEDTEWFGYEKLGNLIRNECSDGIRVEGNYVWLEGKHTAPPSAGDIKERDPEEAKQEAIDLIKRQLEASDTSVPIAALGIEIRNLLGSELIEDTEWFGHKKLGYFIRNECGEDIQVRGHYVWDASPE